MVSCIGRRPSGQLRGVSDRPQPRCLVFPAPQPGDQEAVRDYAARARGIPRVLPSPNSVLPDRKPDRAGFLWSLMTPALFVEFSRESGRQARRSLIVHRVAVRTGRAGSATPAGVGTVPWLLGVVFADPTAVFA
jgi:hypothetical protein